MPLRHAARILLCLGALLGPRSLPFAAPAPLAAQCTQIDGCDGGGAGVAIEPEEGSWSASAASMQLVVNLTWCQPAYLVDVALDGQSVLLGFAQSGGSTDCAIPSTAAGTITLTPGTHTLTVTSRAGTQTGTTTATYVYTRTGAPPAGGPGVRVTPDARPVTRGAGQRATERFTVENTGSAAAALSLGRTCAGAGVAGCTLSHAALTVPGGGIASVGVNYVTGAAGSSGTVALAAWKTGDSAAVNDGGSRVVGVVAVPAPGLAGDPAETTAVDRSACLMLPAGAGVYECGDLRLAHGLPGTRVLNRAFAPTLLYSSQHAHPHPIVSANVFSPGPAVPTAVNATLTLTGVTAKTITYGGWMNGTARLGVGIDASGMPTGFYAYTFQVTAFYADGTSRSLYAGSGTLPIVNRAESRFGAGWWMAGVEEVKPQGAGTLMWIGGDGSTLRYLPVAGVAGRWAPEPYAGTDTIVQLPPDSARYARVLPGGDTVFFDAQGRHRRTVNRRGHRAFFEWSDDALVRMHLPRGQNFDPGTHYALEYGNPYQKLSRVVAPGAAGSRVVTFQNPDGRVRGISGPDTTGVTFGYADLTPRITGRLDRRQVWTTWQYDAGSRLARATAAAGTPDSAVYAYTPQETRGLWAVPANLIFTTFDGPRPDSDVNDRSQFWVDRRGAPIQVQDALGSVTRIHREDPLWPGQVTRVRHHNGREVTSTFDEAGRLSSTTDWATSAGGRYATTLYEWDARCSAVSRVTLPEGEVSSRGY
ncbi:MAG TPA: hypothetical protein VFR81_00445, partial [Longimicrobium sp.]|nr:hypothetical protein [Longimicrobium sp.]